MTRRLVGLLLLLSGPCGPSPAPAFGDEGLATWYSRASALAEQPQYGAVMASGQPLDDDALTCAMRRRDWGSRWKVTALDSGRSVVVTLEDFGPGQRATRRGVIIDLSLGAWRALGHPFDNGRLRVRVEPA